MYESEFCENNRNSLSELLGYSYEQTASSVTQLGDKGPLDFSICSVPEWVYKQDELFNSAEHWLNYHGIKTRTEYGNLLPTYNLFLEIGEWLRRRKTEENDE